jgi:hypothetical protein
MSELLQKKYDRRKMTVIKKFISLIFVVLCHVFFIPFWASAEVYQDQQVKMINPGDTISSTETNASPSGNDEGLEDDGFNIVAGPLSEQTLADTFNSVDSQRSKPAKMKVLTCHITTSTTDMMGAIYPWVETGVKIAHVAHFEIENRSDLVKFKIVVQGPEFSTPFVYETITFGPQKPLQLWRIGYMRTYSIPGLYKIKMTAYPATNKTAGRSSAECSFRVSEPASN